MQVTTQQQETGTGGTTGTSGTTGTTRTPETTGTPDTTGTPGTVVPNKTDLAYDLYALVVFLHKNCNADLFEAVGALELSLTQIKLLHHLEDQSQDLTLKEAADLVLISLPAASRTVDDLYRRGFVERHEDSEDRRMKRVSLTDPGRAVIRRLNAARLSGLEQFTQTLNDAERRKLAGALKKLLERDDVAACRPEGLDA